MTCMKRIVKIFIAALTASILLSSCASDTSELIVVHKSGATTSGDVDVTYVEETTAEHEDETGEITEVSAADEPADTTPESDSSHMTEAVTETPVVTAPPEPVPENEPEHASESSVSVIINVKSKTFHADPSCYHAARIKSENRQTMESADVSALLAQGYKPCKTCSSEYLS